MSFDPFLLLLCEIGIPSKDVFLLVKAANDHTNEEVYQKEATDEHEEDVVEYPELIGPLTPHMINICHLSCVIHEVLPATSNTHDKLRRHSIPDVIKVVVFVLPITSSVDTVPFG